MALNFTLTPESLPLSLRAEKPKVLVTGAAGNIGSYFAEHAHQKYDLRLMVRNPEKMPKLKDWGEVVTCSLSDLEGLKAHCAGVDTVVHMAGMPSPSAAWETLLEANIIGTYNMMVAAKAAGCRRLIFASSIHAVSGYPKDVQAKTTEPVNPGDVYGVSKCFGEALGRYMSEQEGISVICLRIGAFQPIDKADDDGALMMMDCFLSRRDMQQMLEKCVDDTRLRFAIFNVLSDNRFKRLDLSDARELLGYAPQDDFTEEYPDLKHLDLDESVHGHNVRDPGQKSGIREDL